jgi:hypothetical protein
VQDWVVNRSLTARQDWGATPSFVVLSGGEGLIRFNIKGRESPGYFDPNSREQSDYDLWLRERLSAITVADTGEPLIRKITALDDVFPGARRRFLPDLVIEWNPDAPVDRIRSPDIGEIEVSLATGRGGNHNDSAFLMARGEDPFLDAVSQIRETSELGGIAEQYLGSRSAVAQSVA